MENPQVFYTFEWAIAVQRAYENLLAPLVVLAYEGVSLVGVAALARRITGEVVFLTADTGDYCDFLSPTTARRGFVNAVLDELRARNLGRAVFTNLPADSASVNALSKACSEVGFQLHTRPAYECAQVRLGSGEERVLLKNSVLAKKRLRRNIRELTKRGGVNLQNDGNWEGIQPLLRQFTRAHVARFLEMGKTSNLIRRERRVFLEELARELSAPGWIAFSRLMVGDVTAAWNYGFRFAGSWFWYQPTVNDSYGDYSPGYCLLAKILEKACDSPDLNFLDLGLGAEGYKERFANASQQTLYCELNRSMIRHWRTRVRFRAAAAAMASPVLERWLRSAVSFLRGIRESIASAGFRGAAKRVVRRVKRLLFSDEKVLFFEWHSGNNVPESASMRLEPLGSGILGAAAIQYGDDPASLRFLMRSAQRLRSGGGEGFVLLTQDGKPVHFCWSREFEGFEMTELDRTLHAPCENAVMIFDCFTPESARGHGFFPQAIAILAKHLSSQRKSVWIFGAATNQASVHGIEKTGFHYEFTLGRRRILFFSETRDSRPLPGPSSSESTVATS